MIDPHKVAKFLVWFFDHYGPVHSDLRTETEDDGVKSFTSSILGDKVSFNLPALGDLGIFRNIMKRPYLRVSCYKTTENVHVSVSMKYELVSGGSNGNDVIRMDLDPVSYELVAYQYSGGLPVYVK